MARSVIFIAPCPTCGTDARWLQHSDDAVVIRDDFTVECTRCAGS